MIQIMGQRVAVDRVGGKDVLLMTGPGSGRTAEERVARIRASARDCLYMEFHDIFCPRPGLVHPTVEDVRRALAWGKDRDLDEVVCVCQAGISRSSAMAYLLTCQNLGPGEGIKVLDGDVHSPNPLIVALGAELLGDKKIMERYRDYADRQQEKYVTEVPLEFIEHKGQELY